MASFGLHVIDSFSLTYFLKIHFWLQWTTQNSSYFIYNKVSSLHAVISNGLTLPLQCQKSVKFVKKFWFCGNSKSTLRCYNLQEKNITES